MDVGGIGALFGSDVPDVLGGRVDPAHLQRLERAAVEIGQVALAYRQPVDLQIQRDSLERLLPSAILQGDVAGCFRAQVLEIDVNRRSVQRSRPRRPCGEVAPASEIVAVSERTRATGGVGFVFWEIVESSSSSDTVQG